MRQVDTSGKFWQHALVRFTDLLAIVRDAPVFESAVLLAGDVDPASVRRQLVRWVDQGRLVQLRRGLYALAPPYRRIAPHPFLVANHLVPGAVVSLESALSFHGMIPEAVMATTTVGPGRPRSIETPLGRFDHRYLAPRLRFGQRWTPLVGDQEAPVVSPEKALLDLVHFVAGADDPNYLRELRLQNLEQVDPNTLLATAEQFGNPKSRRAAQILLELRAEEASDYVSM
jgi:predicted transcriptional regulator of viral defense system